MLKVEHGVTIEVEDFCAELVDNANVLRRVYCHSIVTPTAMLGTINNEGGF